jgi:hypothetical protein
MINPKVAVTIGGGILVFKLYSTVTDYSLELVFILGHFIFLI